MTAGPRRVHLTLRLPDRTGAAKMALGFAGALRDDGFDVTLVHGVVPVDEPSIVGDFAAIGARTVLEPRLERPYDPRLVPALAALVRREGGACVIGVNQRDRAPALLAAARAGVPGVLMVQNQHRFHGHRPLAAVKRRSYAAVIARRTALAVCTSEVVRDEVESFGLPSERTVVVPNGIEVRDPVRLDADERSRLRAELGAADGELLLLNVGRLDPQKGQDLLLDALGAHDVGRRVHVALVGSAGDPVAGRRTAGFEGVLRRRVGQLGLDGVVTFLGWRDDVARLLAAADGYLHTARWEGPALPLAVMEAMAAGRPTIFTDCSGMPPRFVDGCHGLVARSGDAGSIALRLSELVAMAPSDRSALGERGAELIRSHYRIEDLGRTFARLIRDVIERGSPGSPG